MEKEKWRTHSKGQRQVIDQNYHSNSNKEREKSKKMITVENHKGAIAISVQGKEIDVACEFATLLSYLDEHPKIKNLANLIAKNAYMWQRLRK